MDYASLKLPIKKIAAALKTTAILATDNLSGLD
jgi:hypothetical protein